MIALRKEALGRLRSPEQLGVSLDAALAGDLERRVDPNALVPKIADLRALQERPVDDENRVFRRAPRRLREGGVGLEVDHGAAVAPVPGWPERLEQLAGERGEVVGVLVIAAG